MRVKIALMALVAVVACQTVSGTSGDKLITGTWGGDNAALMLDDTIAHLHIGCTFGNFSAPVTVDGNGRFVVTGSYVLRAYPVYIGPSLPAQFTGVLDGNKLTITVAVNDTVEKKNVTMGPATVTLGKDPQMGPCPICRTPRAIP